MYFSIFPDWRLSRSDAMQEQELFKNELATYEREKDHLVNGNEGRYVVIRDDNVAGIWDTYEDALKAGYERYGLEQFLVKQIQGIDRIQFFTRDLEICQS
jgi:hypothetical protein